MKLVIFGLSITSSWGNGHATTFRGLCRALRRRGHEIVFYEWNAPWYSGSNRDRPPATIDYADVRLFDDWDGALPAIRRELADADAAMLGSYFRPGVRAAEFLAREFDGARLFYDIDTPITVRAYRDSGEAEYLRAAQVPTFDVYFSFTGGPVLRELEDRFGAQRAVALYCAVDPADYERSAEVRPEFECALGYMGTYSADRQPGLEELLSSPARRSPERTFVVAGPQYPADVDWPANVRRYEHIPPADHAAFYSSCRLTLNLTRAEMRRWGWSPSVRIFEAAITGTPIVSDWWEGLDTFLEPGRELLLARSAEDVLSFLDLADDELGRIGEAASRRIRREHTTEARAELVEQEVERVLAPSAR